MYCSIMYRNKLDCLSIPVTATLVEGKALVYLSGAPYYTHP
jgi:hypothetical protein